MRSFWTATAGIALACLPCVLVLLVGAGIGTGALSVIGSALSGPGLVIVAGFLTVLLFAGAAVALGDVEDIGDIGPVGDITTQEDSAQ